MARDRDQLDQDRADLLAALDEAPTRPVRADDLIAAASGTTVQAYPDATWDARLREGLTDLRYLSRHGALVTTSGHGPLRAYGYVDHVGSDLDRRNTEHEDYAELRRMLEGWEPADG